MFRAMLISALTLVAVILPASVANAEPGMTCVSDTDVTYHPGLTFVPQTQNIQVDGALTCLGHPSITAGSYGAHLHAVRSCADLLTPTTGVFTIQWNGGAQGFSTISFSRTATIVAGNIVTTEIGTVVAGDFAGSATLFVTIGANVSTACLIPPGVRSVHTNGDLTITPSI